MNLTCSSKAINMTIYDRRADQPTRAGGCFAHDREAAGCSSRITYRDVTPVVLSLCPSEESRKGIPSTGTTTSRSGIARERGAVRASQHSHRDLSSASRAFVRGRFINPSAAHTAGPSAAPQHPQDLGHTARHQRVTCQSVYHPGAGRISWDRDPRDRCASHTFFLAKLP